MGVSLGDYLPVISYFCLAMEQSITFIAITVLTNFAATSFWFGSNLNKASNKVHIDEKN